MKYEHDNLKLKKNYHTLLQHLGNYYPNKDKWTSSKRQVRKIVHIVQLFIYLFIYSYIDT